MTMSLVPTEVGAWYDPADVFSGMSAGSEGAFWLDAGPDSHTGWSWVGVGQREDDPRVVREVLLAGEGSGRSEHGPFQGGWVGWLDYEHGAASAGAPVASADSAVPSVLWLRATSYFAFDHARRRVWWFAREGEPIDMALLESRHKAPPEARALPVQSRHEPATYASLVRDCRDAIREGDAYQLCLTTRFAVDGPVDAIDAYQRLRAATPSHHGGIIVSGPAALASASPERFLEVSDGVIRTRPIKGTRPRGSDPKADEALARELRDSAKERAENIMIVDLMRNDLSRVCEPGSIVATRLLDIETYPAVHQLVSTVEGLLRPGVTVGCLLDAAFPAGSMTGAPKLSAMTILHRLEGAPRGVFAGAFGWVGIDGAVDLAMVIRSIVVHADGAYVGAGGGITWLSDADEEVAEVGTKARGPLAALGAMLPPGW